MISTTLYKFSSLVLTLLLVAAVSGHAESLWQPQAAGSPFADKRAAKVGDTVTVVIVESATATSTASTDAKKNSESNVNAGQGPLLKNFPGLKWGGGDSIKASGTTSRASKFTATVTATVTKVDQNGNLEVEAIRTVQTNKEKEEIHLTGTVRRSDISSDNTVISTYLANANIRYVGNGPIGSRQKEGLLSKLLGFLF